MPGKHRESRTTDETCRLAARTPQPKRARRGRYWFPLSFFDPRHADSAEFMAVANNHQLLNAIADHIERITAELGIPMTLRGGMLGGRQHSLGFVVNIDPALRQNIPAHRELTRRLKATFHCHTAGLDVEHDIVWLWRIDPTATKNAFAIMTAEGGHA